MVLFELDSTIPFPSPRLQKILRHSYLEYAPVHRTLIQYFDSLPSNLQNSLYDNGPITCIQHTATFCLQNNHQRRAHLRQLAHKRYNNFTSSEDNFDYSIREMPLFTRPTRLVGPHQTPAQSAQASGSQEKRNFLNKSEIDSFIHSCISRMSWAQVPTTPCRVLSAEDNSLLREIEIPDNILVWQFEESFYCHHQYLLRGLHEAHLTPPRPTNLPNQSFTARAILPTHDSLSLGHDLYVTDQVAALMFASYWGQFTHFCSNIYISKQSKCCPHVFTTISFTQPCSYTTHD